jgi:drug/metabolite transporter superfamily protein YnfA
VNRAASLFILLGLFLGGGVYSFWKQKQSRSLITLLAVGSVMALVTGLLQL